jgi:bacterioferritin
MEHEKSVALLNRAVADELQAVHQYLYFHFHLDDLGFTPLAALFKRVAIQEMGHVEQLADRILFLKGDVEMVSAGPVKKITDPEQMLAEAIASERQATVEYNAAAVRCGELADAVSRKLFEALVADEEGHQAGFEKQLDNIRRFGASYLALQSFDKPTVPATE